MTDQASQFSWGQAYHVILCPYCDGNHHAEKCPRVQEIEYYSDGQIKYVKLREQKAEVVYPYTLRTTAGNG